jgi:hypothetical protein
MGKNKTTKSDGITDFADTQKLEDRKRIPRASKAYSVHSPKPK